MGVIISKPETTVKPPCRENRVYPNTTKELGFAHIVLTDHNMTVVKSIEVEPMIILSSNLKS